MGFMTKNGAIYEVVSEFHGNGGYSCLLRSMTGHLSASDGKGLGALDEDSFGRTWKWHDFEDGSGYLEGRFGSKWFAYDLSTKEYEEAEHLRKTSFFPAETRSMNLREFKDFVKDWMIRKAFMPYDITYLSVVAGKYLDILNEGGSPFVSGKTYGCWFMSEFYSYDPLENPDSFNFLLKSRVTLQAETEDNGEKGIQITLFKDAYDDRGIKEFIPLDSKMADVVSSIINLLKAKGIQMYPFNVYPEGGM